MSEINVAVLGASGYAGEELVGLLKHHPNIGEVQEIGREIPDDLGDIDTAFTALPHGPSGKAALALREADVRVIDLSGDFRFQTAKEYEQWYPPDHPAPDLLPVTYGLPEFNRDEIADSDLVGMPGCYPTATLLGIVPVLDYVGSDIEVDGHSGVSGMGKGKKQQADEIIRQGKPFTYSKGREHRHVGEIEQFLDGNKISFSATAEPFFRGLWTKTRFQPFPGYDPKIVHRVLQNTYKDEPFVHILPEGEMPDAEQARFTHGCYIGTIATGDLVKITATLDNLDKGAGSQAVQAFNLMHDLPETTGLRTTESRALRQ